MSKSKSRVTAARVTGDSDRKQKASTSRVYVDTR
jgi:hypothetical protein